jgi:ferritin-like metal-binding protein YciE
MAKQTKQAKQLDALFHDTLKDIYFAEKKILSALPKMAKAAQSDDLRAAFEKHKDETEAHVGRLEQVFEMIDAKPQGKTCDAIIGIIEEGQEIMKEYKGSPALDSGLLAGAQAVEHYEIARYGTLKTWAEELGLNDAVQLLDETLQEEKATDEALTEIAESVVNRQAQAAELNTTGRNKNNVTPRRPFGGTTRIRASGMRAKFKQRKKSSGENPLVRLPRRNFARFVGRGHAIAPIVFLGADGLHSDRRPRGREAAHSVFLSA